MLPLNAALITSRALAFPPPRPTRPHLPTPVPIRTSLSLPDLPCHLFPPLCCSRPSPWRLGWSRNCRPPPGCRQGVAGASAGTLVTSAPHQVRAMVTSAGAETRTHRAGPEASVPVLDSEEVPNGGGAEGEGHRERPSVATSGTGAEREGRRPSVAIIGAGASGLVAAKCMLEAGLAPCLFDQAPSLGGLWRRYPGAAGGRTTGSGTPQTGPPTIEPAAPLESLSVRCSTKEGPLPAVQAGACVETGRGESDGGEPGTPSQQRQGEEGGSDSVPVSMSVSVSAAPGCWGSLRTNLSRFTCSFSDHSWDDACPLFPHAPQLHRYLLSYAHRFLTPDPACTFRYRTRVVSVRPAGEVGAQGQQWKVEIQRLGPQGGQESTEARTQGDRQSAEKHVQGDSEVLVFDHVVVASGLYEAALVPPVPGLGAFPGCAIHSAEYTSASPFAGKRVAVVGASFSGVDIATDVARVAADVAHVVTQGFWTLPRYTPQDPSSPAPLLLPLDLALYRRAGRGSPSEAAPPAAGGEEASRKAANARLRRILCGDSGSFQGSFPCDSLRVEGSSQPRVAISDDYGFLVQAGKIRVHRGRLVGVGEGADSSALVLESEGSEKGGRDGGSEGSEAGGQVEGGEGGREVLRGFDAIILCTGFGPSLPFFSEDLKGALGYAADDRLQPLLLHKATFPPPSLANLAFVGMYRGPYFAAMELQARWAAAVFSGSLPAPAEAAIRQGIEAERGIREQTPRPQFPHGDYVGFCNDLAAEIGVRGPWEERWCAEHDIVLPSQYAPQPGTHKPDRLADAPDSLAGVPDSLKDAPDSLSAPTDKESRPSGGLPADGAAAHGQSPEAQLETVMEASRRGAGVPWAVFRGLVGKWALHRIIESRGEGLPSGTVEGTATFTPRLWRPPSPPSRQCFAQATAATNTVGAPREAGAGSAAVASSQADDGSGKSTVKAIVPGSAGDASHSRVNSGEVPGVVGAGGVEEGVEPESRGEPELLYREEGHFIGPRGTRHRIWKEYVYSCGGAESELSVLFAEQSQRTYLFHTLEFLPQPTAKSDKPQGKGVGGGFAAMPVTDGWSAKGEHLCGEDMYYASYCFAFSGLQLSRFCIAYRVVGPHKDYTSTTVFERASS